MAVKFSPVPEVMPRAPGSEGFISVPNATPEAFGAGVGRAMEGFGQSVQQFSETLFTEKMRRVALSNDMMVTDAMTSLSNDVIAQRSEFEQRRGRAAQDGLSDFNSAIGARVATAIESVPGLENRARLQASAQGLAVSTNQWATNHANTQLDTWNEQSTQGFIDTMRAQAVLNGNDPAAFGNFVAQGEESIRAYAQDYGLDPETTNARVLAWKGETYSDIINARIDQGDVAGARTLFDSVRGQMNAQSQVEITNALRVPERQARVDQIKDQSAQWVAGAENIQNLIAQNAMNPRDVQTWLSRGQALVRADNVNIVDGRAIPRSEEEIEAAVTKWTGETLEYSIRSLVSQGAIDDAQGMFSSVRDQMDAESIKQVEELLKAPAAQARAQALAGASLNGYPLQRAIASPAQVGVLQSVNPTLQSVVLRAQELAAADGFEFQFPLSHSAGLRGEAEQRELVAKGWSTTMNSRHLHGAAIDTVPLRNGQPDPSWDEGYDQIAGYMQQAAQELGADIEWGGNWRSFVDKPHFQLNGVAAPNGLNIPQEYKPLFAAAAQKYNVSEILLANIAWAESSFSPDVISGERTSSAGAIGLMQFMPDTAADMGINPKDPAQSIDGAGKYMRQLLDRYDGKENLAVMAYNWGMGNVDEWIANGSDQGEVPQETRDYVVKVLGGPGIHATTGPGSGSPRGTPPAVPASAGGADLFGALMEGAPEVRGPSAGASDPFQAVTRSEGTAPVDLSRPSLEDRIEYARTHAQSEEDFVAAVAAIRADESLADATLKSERDSVRRMAGTLSEAALTGKPLDQPFPERVIREIFPRDEADKLVDTFRVNSAAGMLVNGAKWSSQSEITNILSAVRDPNSPLIQGVLAGLGLQGEFSPGVPAYDIYQGVVTAVEGLARDRTDSLIKDPAAYVSEHPSVQAALTEFRGEPTMENWQAFAAVSLSIQSHLGVPQEDQHVLTKAESLQQAQLIQQNPAQFLNEQRNFQGEFFNTYMQDISELGGLPVAYQFVGLLPDPKAQDLLSRALMNQTADPEGKSRLATLIDRGITGVQSITSLLEANIEPQLEDYENALIAQGITDDQYLAMTQTVNLLAQADMWYNNTDSTTAAKNAVNAFTSQFDFIKNNDFATALIPKEQSNEIQARMDRALDRIFPSPEFLPGDDAGDAPPNPLGVLVPDVGVLNTLGMASTDDWFRELKANPTWITNATNTGLNVVDPTTNALVMGMDGRPFTVPFDPSPVFDGKQPPRATVQSIEAETRFREGEESRRLAEEAAATRAAPKPIAADDPRLVNPPPSSSAYEITTWGGRNTESRRRLWDAYLASPEGAQALPEALTELLPDQADLDRLNPPAGQLTPALQGLMPTQADINRLRGR